MAVAPSSWRKEIMCGGQVTPCTAARMSMDLMLMYFGQKGGIPCDPVGLSYHSVAVQEVV